MALDALFLDEKLRAWGFSTSLKISGLCVLVVGEPRCYIDVQLDDAALPGSLNPLRCSPDALRLGLAEAVARLADKR